MLPVLLKCLNFKDFICLYKFYPKYRRIDIVGESTISLCKNPSSTLMVNLIFCPSFLTLS